MTVCYEDLIRDRFLNVVFSLKNEIFLDKFEIDDSLGKDSYPGYILKNKKGDTLLTICVKKMNTTDLCVGSEGYVISMSRRENDDMVCSKTMWIYSSSLIGNKYIDSDKDTIFGMDIISIMQRTMSILEVKNRTKNNENDKTKEEYEKYETMFDMFDNMRYRI